MPTPTEIIEQIIDPLEEDVDELTRAIEGDLVHIQGPETITGLKVFTQTVTAPLFVGVFSGHLASGIILDGPIDMNGFGFTNVGGSGFELLENKGNANGYCPLGGDALVPREYLGTDGTGDGTNFLADDGSYKPISAGSVSFGTQLANRVFAGPGSGSAAAPGFRVLVAADIPTLPQSRITNLETDLAGKVPITRTITEGDGLAGNEYDLSADVTLAMGLPATLTAISINEASGTTHSHAVGASSNPGSGASLLKTDASGFLTLRRLTLTDRLLINASTSNLFLKDTSTGFKVGTTQIINPQPGNQFQSTIYTSGVVGWVIDDDGNAEFNNLRVRGEIRSSVFTVSEIAATAGTLGVFKSAANVWADFTTPGSLSSSFTFQAKNSDAGGMLFAVGDIIRFKTWTGSGISDSWTTITARTNNTTYTQYTATLNSGSTSATYRAGSAAVDYGPSGTGFITLCADGTVGSSPNMTMATHAGSPWSAQTTLLRIGNLGGSYGYVSNVYGMGIGQYGASASWITVDTTNGLRIGNNTTSLSQWDTSGNLLIGQTGSGQSNLYLSAGRLQIRNNTTVLGDWRTDGTVIFGDEIGTAGNLAISGGTLYLRTGITVLSQWDSTGMIIGRNGAGQSNIAITPGVALQIRLATAVLTEFDASGNVTLGQVATNQANVFWNNSNKRLQFRGSTSGTVVQSYIDTDGSHIFDTPSAFSASKAIRWQLSGVDRAAIYGTGDATNAGVGVWSVRPAGATTGVADFFVATPTLGNITSLRVNDNNGTGWASIGSGGGGSAFSGFAIGNYNAGVPNQMLDVYGRLWLQNSSAPSTPTGAGVIYTESGALKYKGSSGTVTVLGVA